MKKVTKGVRGGRPALAEEEIVQCARLAFVPDTVNELLTFDRDEFAAAVSREY
jgi:hypothetical protein